MTETRLSHASEKLILRLAGWNRQPAGINSSDHRHSHDLWSLDLCDSGENRVEVGSHNYRLKRGDILLIAPHQEHRFIYLGRPFSCFSFKFDLPHLSDDLKPQTIYAGHPAGLKKRLAVIDAVKACLVGFCPEELLTRSAAFTVLDSYEGIHILEGLLYSVVCHYFSGEAQRTAEVNSDSLLTRMSEFIYRRGGEPVTVEDLAEHLNYSPGYLRCLVRRHTGDSTKRFIDLERIKIMKNMLLYSDIRTKELAGIMCFSDVKYFTRFFQKYTGETPRAWLRRQQKPAQKS